MTDPLYCAKRDTQIAELCRQGVRRTAIAAQFGMSGARVSQIAKRKGVIVTAFRCGHAKADNGIWQKSAKGGYFRCLTCHRERGREYRSGKAVMRERAQ